MEMKLILLLPVVIAVKNNYIKGIDVSFNLIVVLGKREVHKNVA